MSMTLILWKAPVVDDPDEAEKLLGAWYETGDDSGFESSEDIARLASELRSRWPDEYESDPPQDCPWADMPFDQTERLWPLTSGGARATRRSPPSMSLSENRPQRGGQAHFAPKAPQNEPVPDVLHGQKAVY